MRRLALITALVALAAAPALALAATRHEHHFKTTFSTKKRGASTGLSFSTDRFAYTAPAAGQPADRVTKTVFVLSSGTKINPTAVPSCSKAKLDAGGPPACPSSSNVGSGKATVITGLPAFDPVKETATIFASKKGFVAYLSGLQTTTIDLPASGGKLTADVPRICLPPGTVANNCPNGEAILKVLNVTIKARTRAGKNLVTTPRTCPSSGRWTNRALYTFANGDTETETSPSSCHK